MYAYSETGAFLIRVRPVPEDKKTVYILSVIGPVEQTGNVGVKERIMHVLFHDDGQRFAITGKHPQTHKEHLLTFDSIEQLLDRCDAANRNSFLSTPISTPVQCGAIEQQRILKHLQGVLEDDSIQLVVPSNNRRASLATTSLAMDENNYVAPRSVSHRGYRAPAATRIVLPPRTGSLSYPSPRDNILVTHAMQASLAAFPPADPEPSMYAEPAEPEQSTYAELAEPEPELPTYATVNDLGMTPNPAWNPGGGYMTLDGSQAIYHNADDNGMGFAPSEI